MFCVASRSAGCGGRTLSRRTVRKMSRGRRFPPCAGKVLSLPGCWRVASRLPRPRGELHLEGPRRVVDRGWSPRARGSRRPPADEARRVGFIPARAGRSSLLVSGMLTLWGGSPPGRGGLVWSVGSRFWSGWIPARAGRSLGIRETGAAQGVDPRYCGALPSFRGASQPRLRFIPIPAGGCRCSDPGVAISSGRPRTPHPTGDQGRHNRLIDPVAEPRQAPEASPRRSTRPTAEPDDARCGGACSNVLRDQHELVD